MTTYAYVDNSNLYIEGCRVSAVENGMAKSVQDAESHVVIDRTWKMDYGKLYELLCGYDTVARLWGSPPPGDSFWQMVKRKGFTTTVYDKNTAGKEKKVVSDLISDQFEVDVAFWEHAAHELRNAASKFISLNGYYARLSAHRQHQRGELR